MSEAYRYISEEYSDERPTLRLVQPEEVLNEPQQNFQGDILAIDIPLAKGESIYNTYDPSNDVTFLRRHRDLPGRRRQHYVEQNILKFVDEFAVEAPYQKIPGVITRDGRFELAGFAIEEMCGETAALEHAGPREKAEFTGIRRVGELLRKGIRESGRPEHVRVGWTSPPKGSDTNYGIHFHFKVGAYDEALQGYPVTEEILRYDEKFGSLRKSKEIYTEIQSRAGQPWSAHEYNSSVDFLNAPILMYGDEETDREMLEEVFNITPESIDFTREFEGRVTSELKPLIHGYTSLALAMADGRIQLAESRSKKLKATLGRIFYWSKEIGKRIKSRGRIADGERYVNIHDHSAESEYRGAVSRGELLLQSGTSCPVVKGSIYSFAEEQTTLCCTCPSCGKEVEAKIENGKIHCTNPKCRATAPWKKKENAVAEEDGGQRFAPVLILNQMYTSPDLGSQQAA